MLKTLIKKELKRVFSDRRLVFSSFILPAVAIAMMYSIMGTLISSMSSDIKQHIPQIYIQNAPEDFKSYISDINNDEYKAIFIDAKTDVEAIKEEIYNGQKELLVVFDSDFSEKLSGYKDTNILPQISTYYNPTEDYSDRARNRIFMTIADDYEKRIIGERLGSIEFVNAFDIDRDNEDGVLADERKTAGKSLSMIVPMLMTILLFAGAMGIGMDTIAGEKERGTMATMLVTPVKREIIALGKVISLAIVAIISAASSIVGVIISLPASSGMFNGGSGETLDVTALQFSVEQFIQLFLILISMVLIFVGVICLISIIAKNVKEAGTYVAPIYMIIMVLAVTSGFSQGEHKFWEFMIPVFGSITAMKSLFLFELTWGNALISSGVGLLVGGILIKVITAMFNSEKIMLSS